MTACNGLEALCELVSVSQSDAVLACAAAALGNFADDDQNRWPSRCLPCAGFCDSCVLECENSWELSLRAFPSRPCCIRTLRLLMFFSCFLASRITIASVGGLEPLVGLCSSSVNDTVLESAAVGLALHPAQWAGHLPLPTPAWSRQTAMRHLWHRIIAISPQAVSMFFTLIAQNPLKI